MSEMPESLGLKCMKCSRDAMTAFALAGEVEWRAAKLVSLGVVAGGDSRALLEFLRAESGGSRTQVIPLCETCAGDLGIPTAKVQTDAGSDLPTLSQERGATDGARWQDSLESARERQRPRKPSMAVTYSSEEFPDHKEAALAATKAAGCTCEPDIKTDGDEVTIKHDHWCAVLRRKDTN